MRSSLALGLCVCILALAHGANAAVVAANDVSCAPQTWTPTVTFQTSCTTLSVTNASCWSPHLPGASDIVLFPAGTAATMPFSFVYTPLAATTVVIASGASVTLHGAAISVSSCLSVQGSLSLVVGDYIDNGTMSTVAYAQDASVPLGTDCSVIAQGFTPRICGPGQVYVTGTLTVKGLFASLWAPTVIASGATLALEYEAFVWGNVSNYGTITANSRTFFHGLLTNFNGGVASFTMLRPDFWTTTPGTQNVTLSMINYGSLSFAVPSKEGDPNYDLISTKDNDSMPFVSLQIINHNNLFFHGPKAIDSWVSTWVLMSVDIVNYATTRFTGHQGFSGSGMATNYGLFIADRANVWYQNYVSNGGSERTMNGGSFEMGISQVREEQLKGRGVLGPYVSTVQFTNSVFSGTGEIRFHEPMMVQGDLTVETGVTLKNMIAFRSSPLHRGSHGGHLKVYGTYVTGIKEVISEMTMDVDAKITIAAGATIEVPNAHALILSDRAPVVVERGARVEVNGHLEVQKSETPLGAGEAKRLSFSRYHKRSGKGHFAVSDDVFSGR